ncbi:MAG: hypothetical protein K8I29_20200 [Alphaproteobacteria bacterium]|uniref:Uncharacterized protein n=1 Tax=Candidatus Nitrobium versatile TaxID=2884831 RepID=A0A953M3Y8_9BACT|nr:hypothetical protein [Candidatus Nitrobium versatile]
MVRNTPKIKLFSYFSLINKTNFSLWKRERIPLFGKEGLGEIFFLPKALKSFVSAFVIFVVCTASLGVPTETIASSDKESNEVLAAAEELFVALRSRDYTKVWGRITEASRTTIVGDVHKRLDKSKIDFSKEKVTEDFARCDDLCRTYWSNFLLNFEPNTVLTDSIWDLGFIKKNRAEIIITYKKATNSAKLKMMREEGQWKVGLVETFWTRK